MPIPKEITVYVEANNPGTETYGDTNRVIPEKDPDRREFLMSCRNFFNAADRPEDADKFYQAVKQTPSTQES